MTTFVSQAATEIGLAWYPNDPVNLSFRVADVNWAGTYTAAVRANEDTSSTVLATLTVTAVYDAGQEWTTFTFTTNTQVPAGYYYWSCKETNGRTKFAGPVNVDA